MPLPPNCHFCNKRVVDDLRREMGWRFLCANRSCPLNRAACTDCSGNPAHCSATEDCVFFNVLGSDDPVQPYSTSGASVIWRTGASVRPVLIPAVNPKPCCVCQDDDELCPTITKCKHSLCEVCLSKLVDKKCPICRAVL